MPIRRKAQTPPADSAPSKAPEGEEGAKEEVAASAPPTEEVEGEVNGEGEETEGGETDAKAEEGGEEEKKEEKDAGKGGEEKEEEKEKEQVKKVKRTIPAWATLSASKRAKTQRGQGPLYIHPKLDHILLEAIKANKDRNGASVHAIMKYITNKYVTLDLDQRKFHLRKALKRLIEKGMVKQLKGKGFSGSFAIGKLPPRAASDKPVVAPGVKAETLGDTLPLIITRLCEPKEASYPLIKKYLEQHFPKLNVEHRPDVLKTALQKAVEKGHLEQITGKGASGTFQVKRFGDKQLLQGGPLEGAILTAITAMNEPKSCSTTLLRKFLVETHKDIKAYLLVNNLKRTLKRCKMMGWMEQVTGNGLNGTYQLCYPYYPSPAILFPDKQTQESEEEDSEEEEEEDEEDEDDDESEDEAPPRKRYSAQQSGGNRRRAPAKRPAPAARRSGPPPKKPKPSAKKVVPPAKTPKAGSRAASHRSTTTKKATPTSKTKAPVAEKAPPPSKTKTPVAKKAPPPSKTKTPVAKKAPPPSKTKTPVAEKAPPPSKTKTPVAKKMTSRAPKRATPKKSTPKKSAPTKATARQGSRRSVRSKK